MVWCWDNHQESIWNWIQRSISVKQKGFVESSDQYLKIEVLHQLHWEAVRHPKFVRNLSSLWMLPDIDEQGWNEFLNKAFDLNKSLHMNKAGHSNKALNLLNGSTGRFWAVQIPHFAESLDGPSILVCGKFCLMALIGVWHLRVHVSTPSFLLKVAESVEPLSTTRY